MIGSLADAPAEDILGWTFETYGARAVIVTAFQAEGMVALDMASRLGTPVRVLTVDTGRLPQETYDLIDQVRGRYGIEVEVLFPEARAVERMVARHGVNLFHRDPVLRQLCCEVRKSFPLEAALEGLDAWVTGLRRSQSAGRSATPKVHNDPAHPGKVKINPIADWSRERVWEYISEHKVPTHALYDRGYTSIGCAPCTRAVSPGESERAGRWWWEDDERKECGIHEKTPSERLDEEIAWLKT
ncbi:MAG: phosphoadenylyl-sulfate reductase [Actinomycetota bacterium]